MTASLGSCSRGSHKSLQAQFPPAAVVIHAPGLFKPFPMGLALPEPPGTSPCSAPTSLQCCHALGSSSGSCGIRVACTGCTLGPNPAPGPCLWGGTWV